MLFLLHRAYGPIKLSIRGPKGRALQAQIADLIEFGQRAGDAVLFSVADEVVNHVVGQQYDTDAAVAGHVRDPAICAAAKRAPDVPCPHAMEVFVDGGACGKSMGAAFLQGIVEMLKNSKFHF